MLNDTLKRIEFFDDKYDEESICNDNPLSALCELSIVYIVKNYTVNYHLHSRPICTRYIVPGTMYLIYEFHIMKSSYGQINLRYHIAGRCVLGTRKKTKFKL